MIFAIIMNFILNRGNFRRMFEDTKGVIRNRKSQTDRQCNGQKKRQLGYNCIVFENFTASIGDLMVAK